MTKSKPRVLLIATLDTKAEEAAFLRRNLEENDVDVVHLDASIARTVGAAEIGPDAIARAAGSDMDAVRALKHEGKCQAVMTRGAIAVDRCSKRVRTGLEAKGFEVMVFHTLGAGGQTLDQIVRERPCAAVVDMSLVEHNDFMNGGLDLGVPVIFAPGNADFLIAGPIADAQRRFPGKRYHLHNAALTAVRTKMGELRALADRIAGLSVTTPA